MKSLQETVFGVITGQTLDEAKKKDNDKDKDKEGTLDPVKKDQLKGDVEDREDDDLDNDGDSDDSDEYLHKRRKAISGAIKKATVDEEVETLDELSRKTLANYTHKAAKSMAGNAYALGAKDPLKKPGSWNKDIKRSKGIKRALDRLAKEEADLEEVELEENIYAGDYKVGAEKSQFGGYTPTVTHKKKGHTLYSAQHSYKTPEHAKAHASTYLKGYEAVGDRHANRKVNEYVKANKKHLYNEEAETLDEISKKTLGSYVKKAKNTASDLERKSFDQMKTGMNSSDRKTAKAYINAADKNYSKSKKRNKYIDKAVDRLTKEETENLDEISKDLQNRYAKKASKQFSASDRAAELSAKPETRAKHSARKNRRSKGIGSVQKRQVASGERRLRKSGNWGMTKKTPEDIKKAYKND